MIAEDHHPDRDQGATQEAGRGPGEDLPQGLEASLGHTQDLGWYKMTSTYVK